jgi:hypothetical protein
MALGKSHPRVKNAGSQIKRGSVSGASGRKIDVADVIPDFSDDPLLVLSLLRSRAVLPRVAGSQPNRALVQHWIDKKVPVSQIDEINALATEVLGGADAALQWLQSPNLATNNLAPIEIIGENKGFERVKNLLLRIEYGVLA